MDTKILDNPRFAETYQRLADVTLNPRRHTAASARAHSEAVAAHAAALARANGCTDAEALLLENLGRAHDIGKVTGTARPERSLDVLAQCGIADAPFLALVKWHDTSLPWWNASQKGQPPTDKAWRRLAAEVELRLLAMFMVADRVDAPAGWRRNAPTAWFLREARARGLMQEDLVLDLPHHPGEVSAGAAVVRDDGDARRLLLLRVRAEGYELPKGGIEWDELPAEAALREAREEAALTSELCAGDSLGHVDYEVGEGADRHLKRVRYVRADAPAPVVEGALPPGTRERRWITAGEVAAIPLVNDALRPILARALAEAPR